MSNNSTKMDVDNPAVLKRSSSAPMINDLSPTMTTSSSTVTTSRESTSFNVFSSAQTRTRRYSASFTPLHTPGGLSPRRAPRVNQLRQEECIDAAGREAAHEREIHSAMAMSQSWEDLRLVGDPPPKEERLTETNDGTNVNCGNSKTRACDPLQVYLPPCSPAGCSSPSPTRMFNFRQGFSSNPWKTNLSPSPTGKFKTRSSSPIALKPSSLDPTLIGPVKRKCEMDDSDPPAKRTGLLIAHSRLEVTESPVTGSLSSVGTPESISSGDSPGGFMDTPNSLIDHPMQDLAKPDPSPT
ncbi:PPP2R1A-PPP2R2A-interacting phosphatase regulator 1 isoform X2 [Lycorma delicatula]|uniref:PPP2R1A-PPP2R2A-interacting phosphatase regulator 1 isoform X2 n=1 Tax=Lycorma delicatula TaxID=130591 RepID=UPI003F51926E